MTEEPESKEHQEQDEAEDAASTPETPSVTVPKLEIDRPSDFRFHAAYMVYSDAWDKTSSNEVKSRLNESISALSSEKVDYETFYRNISQYRSEFNPEHFSGSGRSFIETQRKKDWRKREERASRNKRHGR